MTVRIRLSNDLAEAILPDFFNGCYLASCDHEGLGGLGEYSFTDNPDEAMTFSDMGQALEFYRRQSVTRPLRDDGEPNRPLTAFTAAFERGD